MDILFCANHWAAFFFYLFINFPWAVFTFTFVVTTISTSIPLLILFPIGFALLFISCFFVRFFGRVDAFFYGLFYKPDVIVEIIPCPQESTPLLYPNVPGYQPVPSNYPPQHQHHHSHQHNPHGHVLHHPQNHQHQAQPIHNHGQPIHNQYPQTQPIYPQYPQTQPVPHQHTHVIVHHHHQGVFSQMKSVIFSFETWYLIAYYMFYKLPSATIMFALTTVLFTPLSHFIDNHHHYGYVNRDLFYYFCHFLSVSATTGIILWVVLSVLAFPWVLLICGEVYKLEQRFIKIVTHSSY
ncbi:hypothetical protein BC833DRAFT_600439 [Globomyces pollinis-pini]|nr:hypothetical protein BC833DRAFT_600439 [Globomyces pollinis-pini]